MPAPGSQESNKGHSIKIDANVLEANHLPPDATVRVLLLEEKLLFMILSPPLERRGVPIADRDGVVG
jgi:hypothetical protein